MNLVTILFPILLSVLLGGKNVQAQSPVPTATQPPLSFQQACSEAGGCVQNFRDSKKCTCIGHSIVEDPHRQNCSIVPKGAFCMAPGRYLCLNPQVPWHKHTSDTFAQKLDEALKKANDKPWLSHLNSYIRTRNEKANQLLEQELYPPENRFRIRIQLREAKEAFTRVLNNRKAFLQNPKSGIPPGTAAWKLRTLDKMIKKVSEVGIEFKDPNTLDGKLATYNAYYNRDGRQTPTQHYIGTPIDRTSPFRPLAPQRQKNTIYLGGMALIFNHSPGSLYSILLHEIGHAIDPNDLEFPGIPGNLDAYKNPFEMEIDCLGKAYSVGAKANQFGEAFADWIAMEAYANTNASKLKPPGFPPPVDEKTRDDFRNICDPTGSSVTNFVITTKIINAQWIQRDVLPVIQDAISDLCLTDYFQKRIPPKPNIPHPHAIKRINFLALVHPRLRHAIGCSDLVMMPNGSPELTISPNYCGQHLYRNYPKVTRLPPV